MFERNYIYVTLSFASLSYLCMLFDLAQKRLSKSHFYHNIIAFKLDVSYPLLQTIRFEGF